MSNKAIVKVCPNCGGDNLSQGSEVGYSNCWGCRSDVRSVEVEMDLDHECDSCGDDLSVDCHDCEQYQQEEK